MIDLSRPRLVLRVAFAGSMDIPEHAAGAIQRALTGVFATIGEELAAVASRAQQPTEENPSIARWYAAERPLLRLVSGLAEGADEIAVSSMRNLRVESEVAAVLPFEIAAFRDSRPEAYRARLDRLLQRCAYVLELDGNYFRPDPDADAARNQREQAYRAQSAFMLRHSDLLVAVTDLTQSGSAGGTWESIRSASALRLPIILLDARTRRTFTINPGEDLDLNRLLLQPEGAWAAQAREFVREIVASPDLQPNHDPSAQALLAEFFTASRIPPTKMDPAGGWRRRATVREGVWKRFERLLVSGSPPQPAPPPSPFSRYRERAASLGYHYSGLYRGAILLNYAFAVAAVALAASSLLLLLRFPHAPAAEAALLAFGCAKLFLLIFIWRNTHRANHERWCDAAVAYRYLAERLREMFYLPRVGIFRPPPAMPEQGAFRIVPQSSADWLFHAIVRSISPAELTCTAEIATHPAGQPLEVRRLPFDTEFAARAIHDSWIASQIQYHARNAEAMGRMDRLLSRPARVLGVVVVILMLMDLALLGVSSGGLLPSHHWLHQFAPWLLVCTTVLPAAVAALNGIRSQSECIRLAERSVVLGAFLSAPGGHRFQTAEALQRWSETAAAAPPVPRAMELLRLVERLAVDLAKENAEWSALYAKELSDPR